MGFNISTDKSGPVFDGRARLAVKAFCDEAEEEVAQFGFNAVHAELGNVLQHPTGFYESHIQTERANEGVEVNDGGSIVYGPWLEGVGSRNRSTRFKGYFTFRRVTQQVDAVSGSIAERVLPKYLRRMN